MKKRWRGSRFEECRHHNGALPRISDTRKRASIAKKSLKTGESVTSLVLKDELLTQKQLDNILDPYALTGPELPAEDNLAG